MRGFKAKALRRMALMIEKDNEPGYVYPQGRRHKKVFIDAMGKAHPYTVSGMAVLASRADRLYNHLKRDLRTGGS